MGTGFQYTARELVLKAMRKVGIIAKDDEGDWNDIDEAKTSFDMMLKSWQNDGFNLWGVSSQTVPVTNLAAHVMDPVRPLQVLSVRFKRNGTEIPMCQMTRSEYDSLPRKDTTGTPTQFYYDRQRESARLYIWPLLAAPNGETLEITYQREFEDQTDLNSYPDIPGEWWETAVYGLGARLVDDFQLSGPDVDRVIRRSEALYARALSFDREGSVFFAGPWAD